MKSTYTIADVVENGLEQLRRGEPLVYPVMRQSRWGEPLTQIRELMADVIILRDWNRSGLGGDPGKAEYYQKALSSLQQILQGEPKNIRKEVLQ